jgi:hypothetical protein
VRASLAFDSEGGDVDPGNGAEERVPTGIVDVMMANEMAEQARRAASVDGREVASRVALDQPAVPIGDCLFVCGRPALDLLTADSAGPLVETGAVL